jgi:hypothetical protein
MKNPDAGFLSLRCKTIERANCGGIATKEGWLSAGHAHALDPAHDARWRRPVTGAPAGRATKATSKGQSDGTMEL